MAFLFGLPVGLLLIPKIRHRLLLSLFQLVTISLDTLLLLPWSIVSPPFKKWRQYHAIKATRIGNEWVRVGKPLVEHPFGHPSQVFTVDALIRRAIHTHGEKPCMGIRKVLSTRQEISKSGKTFLKLTLDDHYENISYNQLNQEINRLAYSLKVSAGLQQGNRVVIFSETRKEWLTSALAIIRCSGTVVTLYPALGRDGILHVMQQTEAPILIASESTIQKIVPLMDSVSHLKTIICCDSMTATPGLRDITKKLESNFNLLYYNQLISQVMDNNNLPIMAPQDISKDDPVIIMYTSGSTGEPKGVLLSHENVIRGMEALYNTTMATYVQEDHETFLGYLPLAHIFELGAEVLMILLGIRIAYSSPLTMLDSSSGLEKGCRGDAAICKPTLMPMVPMVMERIRHSIESKIAEKGSLATAIFKFMMARKRFWSYWCYETPITDKLMFGQIRKSMGGKWRFAFTGGAPLSPETQAFVKDCMCIVLVQG